MWRQMMLPVAIVAALAVVAPAAAAQDGAAAAFEHYERIRAALAKDTTRGVETEAQALAPLAAGLAGDEARRAADAVARAKSIAEAREQFGTLSELLVPRFLQAGLPGVHGFTCSMKQKSWAQRGSTPGNPYYGRTMATCGTLMQEGSKP